MTALEPCPNPECGSERSWLVRVNRPEDAEPPKVAWKCRDCGLTGPSVELADATKYGRLMEARDLARRLWDLLPRAPRWTSEPPTSGSVRTLPLNDAIAEYMRAFGLAVKRVEIVDHPRGGNYAEVYISQTGFVVVPFVPQPPSPAERSDRP